MSPTARLLQVAEQAPPAQRAAVRTLAEVAAIAARETPATTPHERAVASVAAHVVAPTLAVWVAWLLARLKQRGVRRVFFLARDGYMPQHFAAKLGADAGIESSYLYVSRQALHFPAISELTPDARGWIFDRSAGLTPRTVLARLRQKVEDWTAWFDARGWSAARLEAPLGERDEEQLWQLLVSDADFLARLKPQIDAARADVLDYFTAEGFGVGDEPVGIVDLGWHGRLQDSMRRLFRAAGRNPALHGFYFALLKGTPDEPGFTKDALLFDLRLGQNEFPMIPDLVPLMESFSTAPHGSLRRFTRRADGTVAPDFDPAMSGALQAWGLTAAHSAMDRFAEALGHRQLALEELAALPPQMAQWLHAFSTEPSIDEARAWGAYPYVDDQAGHGQAALAKRIPTSLDNVKSALVFGEPTHLQPDPHDRIQWTGASRALAAQQSSLLRTALGLGRMKVRATKALRR